MFKIGVCGHFGQEKNLLNGQTVKTKMLTDELNKIFGSHSVKTVDTHGWRNNPFKLLYSCLNLIKYCENILILPANNGLRVFVPLFLILNKIFRRKLHYVVIGGWLPELLMKNDKLKIQINKFDEVYVETISMLESLRRLGLTNVRFFPNFKRLVIVNQEDLEYSTEMPFKLCTFSRVMKEKGIEDAIEAVKKVNSTFGKEVYTLDIYGQVDVNYVGQFEKLKSDFPKYITYKGMVDFNKSVDVLKQYFALLFPTQFRTEGIPGTIIDAYSAGLPVVASNWDSASEIVIEKQTGFIYDFMQPSKLEEILLDIAKEPLKIINMKKTCLKKAKKYSPDKVINEFINYLI